VGVRHHILIVLKPLGAHRLSTVVVVESDCTSPAAPQVRFSLARRTIRAASLSLIGGRPGGFGCRHRAAISLWCQRNNVPGVTSRWTNSALGASGPARREPRDPARTGVVSGCCVVAREVDSERHAGVATGGFLRAASRTRRALLSGRFLKLFGGDHAACESLAATSWLSCSLILANRSCRSRRVNFHWKGLAVAL
jgi:hypothetical protein